VRLELLLDSLGRERHAPLLDGRDGLVEEVGEVVGEKDLLRRGVVAAHVVRGIPGEDEEGEVELVRDKRPLVEAVGAVGGGSQCKDNVRRCNRHALEVDHEVTGGVGEAGIAVNLRDRAGHRADTGLVVNGDGAIAVEAVGSRHTVVILLKGRVNEGVGVSLVPTAGNGQKVTEKKAHG
jgi:hypothetical protein